MSRGRMVIHTTRYGEGNGDLLMHLRECKSIELAPVTWIPLALDRVRHVSCSCTFQCVSYLGYLQHLRIESVQVEHKLSQTYEG